MKRSDQFYIERASSILKHIQYVTLASVTSDFKPWNSPVRAVFDDRLNCYWFSDKSGQHSQNVRDNGSVFLVIYDSTVPEGQGAGVYIEASAVELSDRAEIMKARHLKHENASDDADRFFGTAVRRVYKAVPGRVWTNDAQWENGVFVRDYRVELSMPALTGAMAE